jgi:HPt (histidine-containing phosphotransfer) domain-containing protein
MNTTGECTLDISVLARLMDQDVENVTPYLLGSLIDIFFNATPEKLNKLHLALDQGNFQTMFLVAHSLKTSCGYLGAERLKSLCLRLESVSREKNLTEAESVITQMSDEYPKLRRQLENAPAELERYRRDSAH